MACRGRAQVHQRYGAYSLLLALRCRGRLAEHRGLVQRRNRDHGPLRSIEGCDPMAADSEPGKRRRAWRTGVGVVLTVAWMLFWVLAVWGDFAASAIVKGNTTLTFNEWGAFVAGI